MYWNWNFSFILLVTFLFLRVNCYYVNETLEKNNVQDVQNVTKTQLPENELSLRQKLINNGLKNFSICAEPTLRHAREVFNDVIADVLTLQNKTDEFNTTIVRLQSFVGKAENLNTNEMFYETFQLMYELRSWISLYTLNDISASARSNAIAEIFQVAFEKNNIATLQREYKENFAKYLNIFYKEFDVYWSSLTKLEQAADARLDEWYQELKRQGVSGDIIWLLWSL